MLLLLVRLLALKIRLSVEVMEESEILMPRPLPSILVDTEPEPPSILFAHKVPPLVLMILSESLTLLLVAMPEPFSNCAGLPAAPEERSALPATNKKALSSDETEIAVNSKELLLASYVPEAPDLLIRTVPPVKPNRMLSLSPAATA